MESFSTNNYKRPVKKSPKKTKALIILFLSTFGMVMFISLYIASIITPNIDIPALSNKDETSTESSLAVNDFKGRIDGRLKMIDMMDQSPTQPQRELKTSLIKDDEVGYDNYQDASTETDSYYGDETEMPAPKPTTAKNTALDTTLPASKTVKTVKSNSSTTVNSNRSPVELRNKVAAPVPARMTKVLVGRYSSPAEAREAAGMFMNSNVAPFIKEYNGAYTLQVGTYSDPGKASDTATTLRNRGFSVQTVQD